MELDIIKIDIIKEFLENCDLKVLDEIFKEFLNSARSENIDLIKFPYAYKYKLVYRHLEIPYLSTIYIIMYKGKRELNIKLNNNGFLYSRLPYSKENLNRHHSAGWSKVDYAEDFIIHGLPNIKRFCEKVLENVEFIFYYNEKEQRADIKAFKVDNVMKSDDIGNIVITFECGYPYMDEEDERMLPRRYKNNL